MEDIALLDAWRSGRREAGQALIQRHYPAVFRFFYGKVPLAVCEDLAQQTFEVLCRRPDAYRGDGSFRAYLFGVARFVLLGWTRRNRTYEPADDGLLAATDPTPSGVVARQQQLRIIATALRRLPVDEDLSQAELAALFAVPQPTVARRLQRARARLHAAVEALCVDQAQRDESLRNLESCLQSIRAQIIARWGLRAPAGQS